MLYQTNPAFPEAVHTYGCYYMDLLRIAELVAGKELTTAQVNIIYSAGLAQGFIEGKCSCVKPDSILRQAFVFLGCNSSAFQVGAISYRNPIAYEWWPWVRKNPTYKAVDYLLGEFVTTGLIGFHFCLLDKDSKVIYDPYDKPYTRMDLLRAHIYRVIK